MNKLLFFLVCISMKGYSQNIIRYLGEIKEAKSEFFTPSMKILSTFSGSNYTVSRYKKIENNHHILVIQAYMELKNAEYIITPLIDDNKHTIKSSFYQIEGTPRSYLIVFDIHDFDIRRLELDTKLLKDFVDIDKFFKQ